MDIQHGSLPFEVAGDVFLGETNLLRHPVGVAHFGNAIDMVETLKVCPKDKMIMGNVDPVGVMKMMNPAEIKAYIGDLLIRTAEFDNFVLSTGCDLPPHVPAENVEAFFEALSEFNQK